MTAHTRRCWPVLALLVAGCVVSVSDSDTPSPGEFRPPIDIALPFAVLTVDPVEATFERRGDDVRVFLRCLDPLWAERRSVSATVAVFTGQGGGGVSSMPIDCPGPRLPESRMGSNDFVDAQPGDPWWLGLDVEDPPGHHTRRMLGFVVQPDGSMQAVPESAATPDWWK